MIQNNKYKFTYLFIIGLALLLCNKAQSLSLFDNKLKEEHPSIVYNFLERYLYQIDSLQQKGEPIFQKLRDDKVVFVEGELNNINQITQETGFIINETDDKFYQIFWIDSAEKVLLSIAFPMQYELLLGKDKIKIEKEFKDLLKTFNNYTPITHSIEELIEEDGYFTTTPTNNYYIETLNTTCYYKQVDSLNYKPIFDNDNTWYSVANLFHGVIDSIDNYKLYIKQNLYNYQETQYIIPLKNWLAYCLYMDLDVYFAVEEERKDGLLGLLIAHSKQLGFNHMLSIIVPDDFIQNKEVILKATMNAYIPTENVKNLYQQYNDKPKKKI